KALKKIEEKINEKKTFDSFFSGSYIYEINGNEILLVAPSSVAQALLSSQYFGLIKETIDDLCEENYKITVVTESTLPKSNPDQESNNSNPISYSSGRSYFEGSQINTQLTFDNFVVGESNKEAYHAALYVARNGGMLYNPLFIYSPTGLGKTHLLHAIGNEVKAKRLPSGKILCLSSDEFVDEYIKWVKAEREGKSPKEYFDDVDILLVDDVQLLAGKDKTQDLFFTIYETLVKRGKRIIITSDKQPSDLHGLEERLVSRFAQGLTLSINEPDEKTCLEILKTKITENNIDYSKIDDIISSLKKINSSLKLGFNLPIQISDHDKDIIDKVLQKYVDSFVIANNVGQLIYKEKHDIIAGLGMNIISQYTKDFYLDFGIKNVILSLENNVNFANKNSDSLFYVLGYNTLMNFAHCPFKVNYGNTCAHCTYHDNLSYQGENRQSLRIRRCRMHNCYFELLNSKLINTYRLVDTLKVLDLRSLNENEYNNLSLFLNGDIDYVSLQESIGLLKSEIK
ncbi:MAG: ATP-binding protein, partial [Bacilli bacterium]|nr:ATP-binding protein [Bacilli bacterium]